MKDKVITLTIRLTEKQSEQLVKIAEKYRIGNNRTQAVRLLIEDEVERWKGEDVH